VIVQHCTNMPMMLAGTCSEVTLNSLRYLRCLHMLFTAVTALSGAVTAVTQLLMLGRSVVWGLRMMCKVLCGGGSCFDVEVVCFQPGTHQEPFGAMAACSS
jgi:hypothetical protein